MLSYRRLSIVFCQHKSRLQFLSRTFSSQDGGGAPSVDCLNVNTINGIPEADDAMSKMKIAQEKWMEYSQSEVDHIFESVSNKIKSHAYQLAKYAVEESGIGCVEDKVLKNIYASEYTLAQFKDFKSVGVIKHDPIGGITTTAEPVGPVCGIVPCTNPCCTVILKTLYSLKTRNCIMFLPHPRTQKSCAYTANLLEKYAVEAGAPKNSIMCAAPSMEMSSHLMRHKNTKFILATGGPAVINIAYSAGKPAIGVGAGNCPAIIDETYDVREAVNSVVTGRTFDYGTICAGEQTVIAMESNYNEVIKCMKQRGVYILNEEEKVKLGKVFMPDGKGINPNIVGKSPDTIAMMAGLDDVPETATALCVEVSEIGHQEVFSHEKLSPILALYKAANFHDAVDMSKRLVTHIGIGHTAALYTNPNNKERIQYFRDQVPCYHLCVNQPTSLGAIGIRYNFSVPPTYTVGVGTAGGSIASTNVGPKELIQTKNMTIKRDYLRITKTPTIYSGKFCIKDAIKDIAATRNSKVALIITDVKSKHHADNVARILYEQGWQIVDMWDNQKEPIVRPASTVTSIFAVGGPMVMDRAKMVRIFIDNQGLELDDMTSAFMETKWRNSLLPLRTDTTLVGVPTTISGVVSSMTPFTQYQGPACIYHQTLQPDIVIQDCHFVSRGCNNEAEDDAFKILVQGLEGYVAVGSDPQSRSILRSAVNDVLEVLDTCRHMESKEKLYDTAARVGTAVSNTGLGLLAAISVELSSRFHVKQALVASIFAPHVMRFNARNDHKRTNPTPNVEYPKAGVLYTELTKHLGISGETEEECVDNLVNAVEGVKSALSLPTKIHDLNISEEEYNAEIDNLALAIFQNVLVSQNPRLPLLTEIRSLLTKAM